MKGPGILLTAVAVGALALLWMRRADSPTEHDLAPTAGSEAAEETLTRPEEVADLQEEPQVARGGRWRRTPQSQRLTPEQEQMIAELNGIGYLGGTELAPDDLSAVTVHVKERAFAGTNFYTSGHAPGAVLMDMDGKVLHTWSADFRELWPGEKAVATVQFWRRAFLQDNGDVLAIFEGHSLVKLDKDSQLLWKSRCNAHHDLEVLANGDILVLTRKAHVVPEFDEKQPILEDFVTLLDATGKEKRSFSLLEALDLSSFTDLRERMHRRPLDRDRTARDCDILHTNSIVRLDGRLAARIPAFEEGNLLVSSRPLSFIAVVDPEREEVVWTMEGDFKEQHDPKVLSNGNLLLFDNRGRGDASTVLELDPVSGATVWEYRGTAEAPFFSHGCGTAERLPNGNTLITESDGGRAFEVTPAGEIVWEFWNPERAGAQRELIATLLELVRLAPDHPLAWRE